MCLLGQLFLGLADHFVRVQQYLHSITGAQSTDGEHSVMQCVQKSLIEWPSAAKQSP